MKGIPDHDADPDYVRGAVNPHVNPPTISRGSVYLGGSITADPMCLEWRKHATDMMSPYGVNVISPCRAKNNDEWSHDGLEGKHTVYSDGAYVARDYMDIKRSDMLLVCWWGDPGRQSLGTWIEIGWATEMRIPFVFCDLTDGYYLKHPFIYKQCAATFRELEAAAGYCVWALRKGSHE